MSENDTRAESARLPEIEDAFDRDGRAYRRHLATGSLLAVLVLVVVAGGLAWEQYTDARESALAGQRARSLLAGSVIETSLRGELSTLQSIAGAPSVVTRDVPAMRRYLARLQTTHELAFSGGLGWIDARGRTRVATVGDATGRALDVSDRGYFRRVMASGEAYVSESITSRLIHKRIVVMAAPTRDAQGRLTGVLVGALRLEPSALTRWAVDLGGPDLWILDRVGKSILHHSPLPANATLAHSLHGSGTIADTRGLDGAPHHAVTYSTSHIAGWTVVIDRPRSELFADARRALLLELALVAAVASLVLFQIGLTLLRGRREGAREGTRTRQRRELLRAMGDASLGSEVSDSLVAGLAESFPGALCLVALEDEHHHGSSSPRARTAPSRRPRRARRDRLAGGETRLRLRRRDRHRQGPEPARGTPGVHHALLGAAHSLYATPLVTPRGTRLGALCLLFAHARPLDRAERRRSRGTPSRPRRRSTARPRSSASTSSPCCCSAACSRTACPRSTASSCSGATTPARPASSSVATGSTPCVAPTGSCTSPSATSRATASTPPC